MQNQVENRAGLTPAGETELMPRIVTGQTAPSETQITPPTRTRRRYKPRARKCRCGCGELVAPTPQAPHKVYASAACRNRDYRRRQAKGRAQPSPSSEPFLELATCAYCGNTFLATRGHSAKYCKPSHRTAAAEARRSAAVEVIYAMMREREGVSYDDALDYVERKGMKHVSRKLRDQGLVYDEGDRRYRFELRVVKG